jgi:DNA-binding PucR family transcriptional regulator
MTGRIADLFDGQCIFEHENGIAAVFNMTKFVGSVESLDTAMSGFLRDNNLVAGRSGIFSGFGEFSQYYKQAGLAYELGAGEDPYSHLHRFRDVVKPYLLNCCSNELPARMICAPELIKLKEYDEEHKTNFYKTLSVFLRSDLHPVKASKELFIARSTFIYRMERIQAITGSDFNKPDDRWYLLLSLELIDRESGRERK